MSQTEFAAPERRGWWDRLMDSLMARKDGEVQADIPADSLFADAWNAGGQSLADVPENLKAQIREEAVLDTFNRLEASLRLLLHATTPGKEPPSTERYQQILNVWRYELEHRINLQPDTYCGAVQKYEAAMDPAYIIDGRCQPGDLLRIRVPCWRMRDKIVIRGEAEVVEGEDLAAAEAEIAAPAAAEAADAGAVIAEAPAAVAEPALEEAEFAEVPAEPVAVIAATVTAESLEETRVEAAVEAEPVVEEPVSPATAAVAMEAEVPEVADTVVAAPEAASAPEPVAAVAETVPVSPHADQEEAAHVDPAHVPGALPDPDAEPAAAEVLTRWRI